MTGLSKLRVLTALASMLLSTLAAAALQTVCTITVNSADEKQVFRRYLPESTHRFVELVERGRPDWLASSCSAGVRCDVLIVSGHYDGSSEFFSDSLELDEYLPVAELERVSCSNACPGLFSRLKEVYLFGCNTLNPQPQGGALAEVVRGLVREGHSPAEAERLWQSLKAGHGDSSRNRMRQVFAGVPVVYGFSSTAPLGPVAATVLNRYFRAGGAAEVGRGRASNRLLAAFSPFSMAFTPGMTGKDPHADARADMCQFADERHSDADRLAFVHQLLQRSTAEARLSLDRIHALTAGLGDAQRQTPAVARVLDEIAHDAPTRARFLAFARDADQPQVRVRMFDVALDLGWLTAEERWNELALMLGGLMERRVVGADEIGLACELNRGGDLDGAFNRRVAPGAADDDVAHAAVRACLGSDEARARTLAGLLGSNEADALTAQIYLRHRPVTDAAELRQLAARIVQMSPSGTQVRALEALGRHHVADRQVVDALVALFVRTPSHEVQAAVAGILLRADRRSIDGRQLVRTLSENRNVRSAGDDIVDALIRRMQGP